MVIIMKIISLVSSYRKNGNTSRVVTLIEKELVSLGEKVGIKIEIEKIALGKLDIRTCRGCRACFEKGEELCPLKDDFLILRDKLLSSDAIIAASPVYVEDINGIMKNWIDRMAFNCHRPAFAGKNAFIITTAGGGSSMNSINTMKRAFISWGIYISGVCRFRTGALMELEEIDGKYHRKIVKAAKELLNSVINNASARPSFYSLLAFKIQQKYKQKNTIDEITFDYQYWKDKGWINKGCKFYNPIKTKLIKVSLARFVGNIVARFFI
jgi:multimeric flavodoxin WrbA